MSIKLIERMKHDCDEMLASFALKDAKKAAIWLKELKSENDEELHSGKEFKIEYLLSLHGWIAGEMKKINVNDFARSAPIVLGIRKRLDSIVDQREVRDMLIKEVIAPIFKSWGFKKKARAFVKLENEYLKKVNVFTSQWADYYDAQFIFEISIEGKGVNIFGKRAKELWFKLKEGTDIPRIKEEIVKNLVNDVKPLLDNYR